MSKTFVKDPRTVAKPGDVVKVKVLEVDPQRKRIGLTMRLDDDGQPRPPRREGNAPGGRNEGRRDDRPRHQQQGRPGGQPGQGGQRRDGQGPGGQGQPRHGRPGQDGGAQRPSQAKPQHQAPPKPRTPAPEPDGAMAEALRRAGLVGSKRS
jgi:uncharacterized protein